MAGSAPQAISDAIWIEDEVWQEAFATRVPSRERHPITGRDRGSAAPSTAPISRAPSTAPVAGAPFAVPTAPSTAHAARSTAPLRRTVRIQGRGAERHLPWPGEGVRRRPARAIHERAGFRPDRLAMWAVLLGLLLVLVAAISSYA